jgi:hypothetical protein
VAFADLECAAANRPAKHWRLNLFCGTNSTRAALYDMAAATPRSSVSRYLSVQAALGCAVGTCFPILLWATNTGAFGSLLPGADTATILIVTVSSIVTFCPLVLATAIGLLEAADG